MNKHLSALWVISGLLTGCATAQDDDGSEDVATETTPILAGHVTLGATSNSCGGGTPQLIFFGTDSAGHETYDFNSKPRTSNTTFCSVQGQILFPANFCVRIKSSSMVGRAFPSAGASGSVRLRSQWLQVVGGFLDVIAPVPASSGSVLFSNNVFQPGPLSPRGISLPSGLQLVVTPTVTASGGAAPSIIADFSFGGATTTIEAIPNC